MWRIVHSAKLKILRDQLLEAFSAQPDLRPRDIIVMVPDINVYAPHIQAVFGRIDEQDRATFLLRFLIRAAGIGNRS